MENGNGISSVQGSLQEFETTAKDVADLQMQIQQLLGLQKEVVESVL